MPSFGKRSMDRIATLDPRWPPILTAAILETDFTVICGHRGASAQTEAYEKGLSKTPWPRSKHNKLPSLAVDLAPWYTEEPHIRWKRNSDFIDLSAVILGKALELETNVRWGGDWDQDGDMTDQTFMDIGHYELM